MLWPFLTRVGSPALVTPAHVLAWAYGIGLSGREPSSATIGARIAASVAGGRFGSARPHTRALRARTGALAAAGCYGAPDRIRTCDLRLRRPTLYPLSYRRASLDDTDRAAVELRFKDCA